MSNEVAEAGLAPVVVSRRELDRAGPAAEAGPGEAGPTGAGPEGVPAPRNGAGPREPADRRALLLALKAELRGYQSALDAFDEAVSLRLGINRTDLRCLDLLDQHQPLTAGALAEASGLTTGAMTFVLDRLERAGFVARRRDPLDRRRVLVELVAEAARRAFLLHEPLVTAARSAVGSLSCEELGVVCRFLGSLRALYERHGAALREEAADPLRRPAPPGRW